MCLWALLSDVKPSRNQNDRGGGKCGESRSAHLCAVHRRTRFVLPTNLDGRPQPLRQTKEEQTQGSGSPVEEWSAQLERLATMSMASATITAPRR